MSKNDLVENNMNLVYHLIHKYYPTFIGNEDFVQEGMLGLCKAASTFDENRGFTFSTYASKCIMNQLKIYLKSFNKNNHLLSIDNTVIGEDGEETTFHNFIVGDEDVEVDLVSDFYKGLDTVEQDLFEILYTGTNKDYYERKGGNYNTLRKVRRRLRRKWRDFSGEN